MAAIVGNQELPTISEDLLLMGEDGLGGQAAISQPLNAPITQSLGTGSAIHPDLG